MFIYRFWIFEQQLSTLGNQTKMVWHRKETKSFFHGSAYIYNHIECSSLILSHRYKILSLTFCSRTRGPMQYHCFVFCLFCFSSEISSFLVIYKLHLNPFNNCWVYRMRQVVVKDGWEYVENLICQWIFYHIFKYTYNLPWRLLLRVFHITRLPTICNFVG